MTSAAPHSTTPATAHRRSAEAVVDRYVRAVRRRLAARWMLAGLLLAGVGVLAVVLLWLAGGVQSSVPLGWLLAEVAGILLAAGMVAGLVRLGLRSPRAVIRRLRRQDARLSEDLWSGLELRGRAEGSTTAQAFVGCHGADLAERLLRVPPREVVGLYRFGQSAWLLLLGAVLTTMAVAFLPGATPRLLAALGADGGPDRLPRVVRGAGVVNVRLVIHPPRYTGLPLEVVTPSKAPVSVIAGSRVTVVAKADPAVAGEVIAAAALVPGGRVVPATLLGERIFRVELVVRRPGAVVFVYGTDRGVRQVGETGTRLLLRRDLPPDLAVQPADEQLDLPRPRVLPLRYEISDDFGLLEARLIWKTDIGDEGVFLLGRGPRFGPGRKQRIAGVLKWDLTRLRLKRGQSVQFHLEARDNRTAGTSPGASSGSDPRPQLRRSRKQTITITGPASARLKVMVRLRALLERSVLLLADRLEHDRSRPCAKRLAVWKRSREAESRLVRDAKGLVGKVRTHKEVPALLRAAVLGPLAKALSGLHRALGSDRAVAAAGTRGDCAAVASLETSGQRVVKGLESWVLALDQLIGRATLEQMQRLGKRIAALQKEIQRLQEELKKNPSAELRRRIARRMKELQRLFDRLGHLWSTLQDDALDQHVNRYALDRKRTRKLLDRMSKKLGKGQPSAADMDQLRRRVDRLKKALDRGLDSFRKFYPLPGERGVQRDLRAIRRLSKEQGRVNRQRGGQPGKARQQQRRLSEQARRLGRGLQRQPGRQGVARLLDDAAKLMRQAAGSKGKSAAQKGKAAKEALDRAGRQLGKKGRLTRQEGKDGEDGTRSGKVEIPPAGGELPRKLRQRILDGGRTSWPENFRQPLKRYYERLLR